MNNIKFVDLLSQYLEHKESIDAQIADVIQNTSFIMGSQVPGLERCLADFVGSKHAIACASGTDALSLALMAYGVKPGDEIITTTYTFIATGEVIALLGAKPVFVDIHPQTYNIDPDKVREAITDKTRGIIPVDLFGLCADYTAIRAIAREHGLFVIEDAAQSLGAVQNKAMAGNLADIGCTSFFPAKPLGCYGDGGMCFTNSDEKADIMRSLRIHGKGTDKYNNVRVGLNSRLDTIQAGILLAKFPGFAKEIRRRQDIAEYYTSKLPAQFLKLPIIPEGNASVYAQYSICTSRRDDLQKYLTAKGVPTAIYYPTPLHQQDAFAYLNCRQHHLPVAEQVSQDILALPIHPYLTEKECEYIVQAITEFFAQL